VAVAVSPDGTHVYVAASVAGSGGVYDSDYLTLAYRAGTGTVAWAHRYDGPADIDWPTDIAVSGDGKLVVVTGASTGLHGYRTATVGIEAVSGAQTWVRRTAGMLGGSIVAAPSGSRTYLTTEAGDDFLTIALTGWGGERWRSRYDGPGTGFAGDAPAAIAVAPDGSAVFVTGSSWSDGHGYDYATVAYGTSDGARRWAKRYTHPAFDHDEPADVGVSRDGGLVVVTGASPGVGGDADVATVAYDVATGSTAWVDRFDGSARGDDVGTSIAAGLEGAVVVAGSTASIDTGLDILTLVYAAGP
jgi:DNA-binding beta-propeller fold protein YncE